MAHPTSEKNDSFESELLETLQVDKKGWNVILFDSTNITGFLCNHCNNVCKDAVELGCAHADEDIYSFCHSCLADLIKDKDGKCIINNHSDPIMAPSRSIRRQIAKSQVICPYSKQYKIKYNYNSGLNLNEEADGHVIDTSGHSHVDKSNNEGKEGVNDNTAPEDITSHLYSKHTKFRKYIQ